MTSRESQQRPGTSGGGDETISERLHALTRRAHAVLKMLGPLADDFDTLVWDLHGAATEQKRKLLPDTSGASSTTPRVLADGTWGVLLGEAAPKRVRLRLRSRPLTDLLKRAALAGVQITFHYHGDTIDAEVDGVPLRLPPKTARLLWILASPSALDPGDGLVGWKSRADIAAELNRGAPLSSHALTVAISRLRDHLEAAGLNPLLVECRAGFVRIRRRQKGAHA